MCVSGHLLGSGNVQAGLPQCGAVQRQLKDSASMPRDSTELPPLASRFCRRLRIRFNPQDSSAPEGLWLQSAHGLIPKASLTAAALIYFGCIWLDFFF